MTKQEIEFDAETTIRLIKNTKKWTRVLDDAAMKLADSPTTILHRAKKWDFSNLSQQQFNEVKSLIFSIPAQAHMVAISLRQIFIYSKRLQNTKYWTGSIAKKGAEFQKQYNSEKTQDLRDVLEHSADYIVGKGRKPKLVKDLDSDWPTLKCLNGKMMPIGLFGIEYELAPIITSAIEFTKLLPSSDELGDSK